MKKGQNYGVVISFIGMLFLPHCIGYSRDASTYWENLAGVGQAMHNKFYGTNTNAILNGSLSPKDEDELYTIDENTIYLGVEARKSGNSWVVQKTKSTNPRTTFSNKVTYTKIVSGKDELYDVFRKQYTKMGDARPSITFMAISQLIEKDPSGTETQKNLCRAFHCDIFQTKDRKTLSYTFGKNTQSSYPAFYEKFANRFRKLRFNSLAVPDGKKASAIRVENQSEKLLIHLPVGNQSGKAWKEPKRIDFYVNFSLDSFGLNFQVSNLLYVLNYKKIGTPQVPVETLNGRFAGRAQSKIEGRFFYVIPQGFVNLFIPEDIETYLTRGLELVTVGTDGKKGNRFSIKFTGKGNDSSFELRSYAEIYRNKFSLFGDKKPTEEGKGSTRVFFEDFWLAISRDLAQPVK